MIKTVSKDPVPSNGGSKTQCTVEIAKSKTNTTKDLTTTAFKTSISNESSGEKIKDKPYSFNITYFPEYTPTFPNNNNIKTVEVKENSDEITDIIIVAIIFTFITVLVIVGCLLCKKKSKKGIMVETATLTGTETELDDIKINENK
uniref:Uncharacterized protein n=1 Tax=Strongyloides papillosus TaxID=174720 RepID=A0A0N5B301_STREA